MNELLKAATTLSALAIAVIATAITCVYARHEARKQFTALQVLIVERDTLEVEWGRLQIEQSTWSTHSRVERLARSNMKMRNPAPAEIMVVQK
jgi:cell division protein FtsL